MSNNKAKDYSEVRGLLTDIKLRSCFELLFRNENLSLTEEDMAKSLEISKSHVKDFCDKLCSLNLLTCSPDGHYTLNPDVTLDSKLRKIIDEQMRKYESEFVKIFNNPLSRKFFALFAQNEKTKFSENKTAKMRDVPRGTAHYYCKQLYEAGLIYRDHEKLYILEEGALRNPTLRKVLTKDYFFDIEKIREEHGVLEIIKDSVPVHEKIVKMISPLGKDEGVIISASLPYLFSPAFISKDTRTISRHLLSLKPTLEKLLAEKAAKIICEIDPWEYADTLTKVQRIGESIGLGIIDLAERIKVFHQILSRIQSGQYSSLVVVPVIKKRGEYYITSRGEGLWEYSVSDETERTSDFALYCKGNKVKEVYETLRRRDEYLLEGGVPGLLNLAYNRKTDESKKVEEWLNLIINEIQLHSQASNRNFESEQK